MLNTTNTMTPISAIQDQLKQADKHSIAADANLTIKVVTDFSLIQLAAWADTLSKTEHTATQIAGAAQAPGFGSASVGDNASLLRVEPLKYWMIFANNSADDKRHAENVVSELSELQAETTCVLDLSHSRTWLQISGSHAPALLNHFLPIDLRDSHFAKNTVVNTAFHHIGVTLWRSDTAFELLLPRSFAASLTELLTASARQYGYKIITT